MKNILLAAFTFFILITAGTAYAVPVFGRPVNLTQPGAGDFQALMYGDEFGYYLESPDGYTLFQDGSGAWYYAEKTGGELLSSGILYPSSGMENSGIPRKLRSDSQGAKVRAQREQRSYSAPGLKLAPPIKDTVNVLAVLMEFPSPDGADYTAQHFIDLFTKTDTYSVYNYFRQVSDGQFTVNVVVAGDTWHKSAKGKSYYGANASSTKIDVNAAELVKEAAACVDTSIDLSIFDRNGDRVIDYFVIIHSGKDEADSGSKTTDIWSHKFVVEGGAPLGTYSVYNYSLTSEASGLGTIVHEMSHNFGAPDLYDVDYVNDPVGYWCLMSAGNQLWPPAPICGYLRMDFDGDPSNGISGWLSPLVPSSSGDFVISSLADTEAGGDKLIRLNIPGSSEYFLVENRYPEGYDLDAMDSGVVLYHVDERYDHNSGNYEHYRVWVEDPWAPDHTVQETGNPVTDALNYYNIWGKSAYLLGRTSVFGPSTIPASATNDWKYTGLEVRVMDNPAKTMTVRLDGISVYQVPSQVFNSPNPFLIGRQQSTIIHANAGERYYSNLKGYVYDMTGDLVRELETTGTDVFPTSGTLVWDGRNADGSLAASGVYFYVVTYGADKVLKGKISAVR